MVASSKYCFGTVGNQDVDALYLDRLFIYIRLIQSHAKAGPTSARLDENAKAFAHIVGQQHLEFLTG